MRKILGSRNILRLLLGATSIVFMTLLVLACGGKHDSDTAGPGGGGVTPTTQKNSACDPDAPANVIMQGEQFISNEPNTYTVNQRTPSSITVPVNAIVKWFNGENPNTSTNKYWIKNADETFSTPEVGPGQYFCIQFTSAGIFNYHCATDVTGTVIVTAPTGSGQ